GRFACSAFKPPKRKPPLMGGPSFDITRLSSGNYWHPVVRHDGGDRVIAIASLILFIKPRDPHGRLSVFVGANIRDRH
ncbi:MAG: hypothetical protein WB868_08805, partial [Xanthobacteraceae bacterium]